MLMVDAWLDAQMNVDDKKDHLLMRIAANVLRAQGAKVTEDEMKVRFVEYKPIPVLPKSAYYPGCPRPLTQEDIDKIQSASLRHTFGVGVGQGDSSGIPSIKNASVADMEKWQRGEK